MKKKAPLDKKAAILAANFENMHWSYYPDCTVVKVD